MKLMQSGLLNGSGISCLLANGMAIRRVDMTLRMMVMMILRIVRPSPRRRIARLYHLVTYRLQMKCKLSPSVLKSAKSNTAQPPRLLQQRNLLRHHPEIRQLQDPRPQSNPSEQLNLVRKSLLQRFLSSSDLPQFSTSPANKSPRKQHKQQSTSETKKIQTSFSQC